MQAESSTLDSLDIEGQVRGRDAVLVVPPLVHTYRPALGVHLLQGVAREQGYDVGVLYVSHIYAAAIGRERYTRLSDAPLLWFLGERLFARSAWGVDALSPDCTAFWQALAGYAEAVARWTEVAGADRPVGAAFDADELRWCAEVADAVVERVGRALGVSQARWVGASTTFDQTAPSVALLRAAKRYGPVRTVLGGRNCDGPMGRALHHLLPDVDAVVSGEGERAFLEVLAGRASGWVPGTMLDSAGLEALPTPDYADYFAQGRAWLPEQTLDEVWLNHESSRGCWWGAKRHCRFCGLIGTGMADRHKSAERVLGELDALVHQTGVRAVNMTDNIMPHAFHRALVPALAERDLHVFYEIKANLRRSQVEALARAGVHIQPGIESLSTEVLGLMEKGQLARQCVDLLRHARGAGLPVTWNLLYGVPGEDPAWYEAMLALLPKLVHLPPPVGTGPIALQRFAPYAEQPQRFGIGGVRAHWGYRDVLPVGADVDGVAYYLEGDWQSVVSDRPDLVDRLIAQVARWRQRWAAVAPVLEVRQEGAAWRLVDTRDQASSLMLSRPQARAVALGVPRSRAGRWHSWAVQRGWAVWLDGWCVPLATASCEVLGALEVPGEQVVSLGAVTLS